MRLVATTAAACSLFACVALAQEVPAQAPAPAAAESNLPGTTVFSEAQARTHVESRGYTRLRKMSKGPDGLWTGTANKGGTLGIFSIEKMGKVDFVPAA